MRRVKMWLNSDTFVTVGEVNLKPSLTVPDEALSIPEILSRYTRGIPIGGSREPVFDDENDLPDIRTLDLSERDELRQYYTDELRDLRTPKKKDIVEPLKTVVDGKVTE